MFPEGRAALLLRTHHPPPSPPYTPWPTVYFLCSHQEWKLAARQQNNFLPHFASISSAIYLQDSGSLALSVSEEIRAFTCYRVIKFSTDFCRSMVIILFNTLHDKLQRKYLKVKCVNWANWYKFVHAHARAHSPSVCSQLRNTASGRMSKKAGVYVYQVQLSPDNNDEPDYEGVWAKRIKGSFLCFPTCFNMWVSKLIQRVWLLL